MVIVYQSHTGFTKEYAQMLGKAEKMKTYTLAEAERQLLSDAQVFYMGPLTAGHIGGLDRSMKRWKIQGVCGVGMSQPINHEAPTASASARPRCGPARPRPPCASGCPRSGSS